MVDSYPLSVHTTYQDLLNAHTVQAVADIPGTPFLREIGSRGRYWYSRLRIGDRTLQRYIGPDTPDNRTRIEAARNAVEARRDFERRCARLVAQLRAAGLPTLDRETGKVLNALTRIGVFRLGGTLIGTHAFRLYAAALGVRLGPALAATSDIDIAAFENLKLVIDDRVDPSLAETLKDLDLRPLPSLDKKNRATRWTVGGSGPEVEFLAPRMKGERDILELQPLGVHAQALPFLNFLIADPIPAVALYRSGLLVQIPRPERYAIHKLIVATRRKAASALKSKKDLAQAELLMTILLEDRPHELRDAYQTARKQGPKWRSALDASAEVSTSIGDLVREL